MNLLTRLSIKNLTLNKKRTIGTIIGVILSTAMICAVSGLFTSVESSLVSQAAEEDGYYHLSLSKLSSEDINDILVMKVTQS